MKILKMLSLGLVLVITSSCQLDQWENITLNPGASIALSASGTSVVLTKEKEGQEAFTLTWPKPDFGFEAAPNYTIYMDKTGGSFSAPVAINVQGSNSKTFKTEELNKHLLNLKFVPGQSGTLIVKVEAQLGAKKLISEIQNIQVTAYSAFLDLTTSWGVVGSGYNNWGQFPDAPFYTSKTPNVIVAYVTLKDGEIKFRENNKWDNNVGDNGKDGTLEKNGDNIPVTAGNYKITFNTLNNTYTIVPYSWGIVGSAYNNWGETPDFNFVYDDASDQWRALVQLKTGEFKIRKNSDWSVNYGDTGKN
ncbi:MAG: SusE domain-containing protein, partial [Cyclobacteriaceae bacterium]